MKEQFLTAPNNDVINDQEIKDALKASLESMGELKKVLIVPPDITRSHAYAGPITRMLWDLLPNTHIDIMPALGTHMPMTKDEAEHMFPGLPFERFLKHDWRHDTIKIGEVPAEFVSEVSEGRLNEPIEVEVNKLIVDNTYDLIISVGQVVPHEVVGMANYSKNILVGCGGDSLINKSHYLGSLYGMERMMGRHDTPVRRVFDYAEEHFLKDVPLLYVLTVTTTDTHNQVHVRSLSIGRQRELFTRASEESVKHNLILVDEPFKKAVVYLDPDEFRTTWVANKGIYRTRMAMADHGELIILAPGVEKFGEDPRNDALIAEYGYYGYERVAQQVQENEDLQQNLGVAAHLIHGSSEGRFRITYAPKHLTREQVEAVGFHYMAYEDAVSQYDPAKLIDGYNTVDGEEVFYISNPALGLWAYRDAF